YGLSIGKMIIDGRYNYIDPFIKLMSLSVEWKGESYVLIELVQFGRTMKSRKIAEELHKHGFRPATLPELLAYGAAHPEQQKIAPIVALGSIWCDALGLE